MLNFIDFLKTLRPFNTPLFVISVTISTAGALYLYFNFSSLPNNVPLWYFRSWGEGRLTQREFLWLFPILSIGACILNQILATVFGKNYEILSRILVWSSLFVSWAAILSLYNIIRLFT